MNNDALIFLGFLAGFAVVPVAWLGLRSMVLDVCEGETVLIRRFGRLVRVVDDAGAAFVPDRWAPWLRVDRVSRRLDFRQVEGVVSNDLRGTTVIADVWVELRVTDPVKTCFAVENWDDALNNLVHHAVTSIFGRHTFEEIHGDKSELAGRLQAEIAEETARWGILVEHVFLQKVSVLPEVAEQLFRTVAARLEKAKADIEEEGHQRVALLEAETSARTARLVAEARGQYAAAVARAYSEIRRFPAVFRAYEELYALGQLRPHRTTAFRGFSGKDLREADAAMLAVDQGPPAQLIGSATRGDAE